MNSKKDLEAIHISLEESVLFDVSIKELESFETIIHQHDIGHHSLFLETLTPRTYLYHPKEHVVLRPIAQGVIKYRQLGLTIISFQEWLEHYILETTSSTLHS